MISGFILTFLSCVGFVGHLFRPGGKFGPPTATEVPETPSSVPQTQTPSTAKMVTLTEIATSMRDFEGSPHNPRTGQPDPNWRNNNPLNCKLSPDGYLAMYGRVTCSPGGFAVFETYALGWLYGCNELKGKIHNHPNWTLLDLISNHAPSGDDNDPLHYTQVVATKVGVDIHFPVKNIVLV